MIFNKKPEVVLGEEQSVDFYDFIADKNPGDEYGVVMYDYMEAENGKDFGVFTFIACHRIVSKEYNAEKDAFILSDVITQAMSIETTTMSTLPLILSCFMPDNVKERVVKKGDKKTCFHIKEDKNIQLACNMYDVISKKVENINRMQFEMGVLNNLRRPQPLLLTAFDTVDGRPNLYTTACALLDVKICDNGEQQAVILPFATRDSIYDNEKHCYNPVYHGMRLDDDNSEVITYKFNKDDGYANITSRNADDKHLEWIVCGSVLDLRSHIRKITDGNKEKVKEYVSCAKTLFHSIGKNLEDKE